jgi:hypothetical protein
MVLNHINIPLDNVEETKLFFEEYFDFHCTEVKGAHALAVLKGADGFTLVLMSNSFNRNEITGFPSAFHIGFLLSTREQVINQYNKLKTSALDLKNEPANMRGVFGFYFMAPGNILVEISSDEQP